MKLKIEIQELDEKSAGLEITLPKEIELPKVLDILKNGFEIELMYSHIEEVKDFCVISFTCEIEKAKLFRANCDKVWFQLTNRMN